MRCFAAALLGSLIACGTGSPSASSTPPAAATSASADEFSCNAALHEGPVGVGESVVLLRRTLRAGDRISAATRCTPPDAPVLEFEGPAPSPQPEAADTAALAGSVIWTEFPRPLPRGVRSCPAAGCGDGGAAWLPPLLDRRITVAGEYVLRLGAPERRAECWVCVRIEPGATPAE